MGDRTLQVGVKVLLKNTQGKYLLLFRSKEKYPEVQEPWDMPGGRIHVGASLIANLRREVSEETGLEVQGEPRLIGVQDILRVPDRHVIRLTFMATTDGEPVLSKESTKSGWFSLDEIERLPDLDRYLAEVLRKLDQPHVTLSNPL